MPMSFPNMQSLMNRATQRGFRQPHENEEEDVYRAEFANFMRDVDLVESLEIADGRGWDAQGPFGMMAGLMKAKPEIKDLMDELTGNKQPEPEVILPYPHLMITSARDSEMCFIYNGDEAVQMIEELAVMMQNSPVVRTANRFKDDVTNVESMSAAASRYVVSKMLAHSIEQPSESPFNNLARELAARMLVQDLPLNISISRRTV